MQGRGTVALERASHQRSPPSQLRTDKTRMYNHTLTVLDWFTAAPNDSSVLTTASWPSRLAMYRGVVPSSCSIAQRTRVCRHTPLRFGLAVWRPSHTHRCGPHTRATAPSPASAGLPLPLTPKAPGRPRRGPYDTRDAVVSSQHPATRQAISQLAHEAISHLRSHTPAGTRSDIPPTHANWPQDNAYNTLRYS